MRFRRKPGEQLQDQFVCATSDQELHRKLLNAASGEGLTWKKMVEITNNYQCTNAGLESMQKGKTAAHLRADHVGLRKLRELWATRIPRKDSCSSDQDCYRCLGKGHGPGSCRFKEFQCHGCGKSGHLVRACRNTGAYTSKAQEEQSTGHPLAHLRRGTVRRLNLWTKDLWFTSQTAEERTDYETVCCKD